MVYTGLLSPFGRQEGGQSSGSGRAGLRPRQAASRFHAFTAVLGMTGSMLAENVLPNPRGGPGVTPSRLVPALVFLSRVQFTLSSVEQGQYQTWGEWLCGAGRCPQWCLAPKSTLETFHVVRSRC